MRRSVEKAGQDDAAGRGIGLEEPAPAVRDGSGRGNRIS
jgi:hypothetical protein